MNQTIANIIKDYIDDLDFVDKIAGLVSTTYLSITDDKGVKVTKSFPISCTTTANDCKEGLYNDLCPDSRYKTIIYFEDGGVTFNKHEGVFKCFTSKLRLVCWINILKLEGEVCPSGDPCTASADIIKKILCALPTHPVNVSPFATVFPVVTNQVIRSNAIFSQYSYNEKQTQYLMYPYDYFALEISTDFCICMTDCT